MLIYRSLLVALGKCISISWGYKQVTLAGNHCMREYVSLIKYFCVIINIIAEENTRFSPIAVKHMVRRREKRREERVGE